MKKDDDRYSLEAERRYYQARVPHTARPYHWLSAYLECLPMVESLLKERKVLDIGAGECVYGALIAERYGGQVIALELFPERMLPAATNYKLPNLRFVAGDCRNLPFTSASFDIVFGNLVLHHFPVPGLVVKEIRRMLRPGGAYIGIEPNFCNPVQRLLHRFGAKSDNERPLMAAHLCREFEQSGFQVKRRYFWSRFPNLRNRYLTSSVGVVAQLEKPSSR